MNASSQDPIRRQNASESMSVPKDSLELPELPKPQSVHIGKKEMEESEDQI